MKKKILKITVILLFLVGLFFSCQKAEVNQPKTPDVNQNIDFSNIENLYEQPLHVIQKCIEGNWKLQYSSHQYPYTGGAKTIDIHGYYIHLTPNHIIRGNNSQGIFTNSPIIWVKEENFLGNDRNPYLLSYNHGIIVNEQDGVIYEEQPVANYLLFLAIKNDTLSVWDCLIDGFIDYYTKTSN